MIVLAIDTSAAASAALVNGERLVAERTEFASRHHVEFVGPVIRELLDSGPAPDAVIVGVGPGPFTGLRAGIAAGIGAALGLGVPVHGVVSHDALALRSFVTGPRSTVRPLTVVATDARRREVYASAYSGLDEAGLPVRIAGPEAQTPAVLADELADRTASAGSYRRVGRGFDLYADVLGAPVAGEPAALDPTAEWLGRLATRALKGGRNLSGTEPLYLRDPDATPVERRRTLLS